MKKMIAIKLKALRNNLGYSVEFVADALKPLGFNISPNTLYNYENGISQPKADMFLNLCKIYNVTDFNIFYDETDTPATSHFDHTLITAYRAHPEAQASVNKLLDIEPPSLVGAPIGRPPEELSPAASLAADLTRELNQVALDMQSISERGLIKSKAP